MCIFFVIWSFLLFGLFGCDFFAVWAGGEGGGGGAFSFLLFGPGACDFFCCLGGERVFFCCLGGGREFTHLPVCLACHQANQQQKRPNSKKKHGFLLVAIRGWIFKPGPSGKSVGAKVAQLLHPAGQSHKGFQQTSAFLGAPTLSRGDHGCNDFEKHTLRGSIILLIPYSHYYRVGGPPKIYKEIWSPIQAPLQTDGCLCGPLFWGATLE